MTTQRTSDMTNFRKEIQDLMEQKQVKAHTLANMARLKVPATLYRFLCGKSDMRAGNLEKVITTLKALPDIDTER